ncbi:hypothetical protein GW17_00047670 [Ensete ventricosum]|nr:hypothetical protein GW17_00047670 [Ensete ventricosum]
MGIPHSQFEEKLEALKAVKGVKQDTDLTAADLKELVTRYKNVYTQAKGEQFPTDPKRQLYLAVIAVFDSWDSPRANKYRSINQIKGLKGTAVNVQCMVFGNMGNTSGTGVLFTRNPSTGEKKLYGEFLINAQVSCIFLFTHSRGSLDEPCHPYLRDIEFTVQENRLWMLQCRTGKRTGKGAVKIAADMVNEGLVDKRCAIKMVEAAHLDQLLHPQFEDPSAYKDKVIATGLPASPGAAVGQVVFTADDAEAWHAQGKAVILDRAHDERIKAVRKMIMAANLEERQRALDLLLPYQRLDFEGIFRAMDGFPVTIRLLDPPLHEFLPEGNIEDIVAELASETGTSEDDVFSRIEKLSEVNPMLGFRGCRFSFSSRVAC